MKSKSDKPKTVRSVVQASPDTKSILKKGGSSENHKPLFVEQKGLLYNKIEPDKVYEAAEDETKNLVAAEKPADVGNGGHAQIIDQRFEQYLAGQRKLAFELGEQKTAIKNLQFSLQERIALYETSDAKIWRLTETIADIGLNFAIQMMKLKKFDEADSFMQISRKALEPLPGCEWSERHEWHALRRDLYKNLAVLHQSQDNWQQAFDNLRMVITHEKRIGDNTANSQLTCGVLLSKMNRFAESIEFAQEASNEVERVLGITLARPLQDFRYTGKQRDVMEEKDKQFTTYAIANHLIAKSLMNLQYFKEARHFLQKASTAVSKCLNQPKKELQVAIGNDLARLTQVSRGNLKAMTGEQIKSSLLVIKTDLATKAISGIGGDKIEQRVMIKEIEKQLISQGDFLEEVKGEPINPMAEDVEIVPTAEEKAADAKNEALNRKKQEKAAKDLAIVLDEKKAVINRIKQKESIAKLSQPQVKQTEQVSTVLPVINKPPPAPAPVKRRNKSQNVKTQKQNLAKEGAEDDAVGVKYSKDRSVKSYLRARKQQIRELNKNLGYSESDQSLDDEASLPAIPKVQTVSEALVTGLGSIDQQMTSQGTRRHFKPKRVNSSQMSLDDQSTVNILNQIERGIAVVKKEKVPTPTPSVSSDGDVAVDEINSRLQKQIQFQSQQDNLFQETQERPQDDTIDLDTKAKDSESQDLDDREVIEAVKLPVATATPNNQRRSQQDPSPTSKQSPENKTGRAKVDTGLKVLKGRKFGDKIEDLSTLKRQRTPPLQNEIKKNKEIALLRKHSLRIGGSQPSQKQGAPLVKRKSLVYALKKEKNLNVGHLEQAGALTPSRSATYDPAIDKYQKEPTFNKVVNVHRLNQLSEPKVKVKVNKELTDAELIAQIEKQAELEERKNRHKKIDFANFLNREVTAQPAELKQEFLKPMKHSARKQTSDDNSFSRAEESSPEKTLAAAIQAASGPAEIEIITKKPGLPPRKQFTTPSREEQKEAKRRPRTKAPTQTLISAVKSSVKTKVSTAMEQYQAGIRNPYASYVNLDQDSDVIEDREQKQTISSLKQLRQLEIEKAVKIQALIRQYMTRKWYLNLQVRKRLSVPFSGLDFAQHPFLRQFGRVNQNMQGIYETMVEIIDSNKNEKRTNLIQIKGPKKLDPLANQRDREDNKIVTRKVGFQATPEVLLTQLKNEFIEKGLDAYEQFKKLGVGVDFNEQGQAFTEGGIQKVRKLIKETRQAKLEFIGFKNILDKEERPDLDPQKIENVETMEYLQQIGTNEDRVVNTDAHKNVSHQARHHKQFKDVQIAEDNSLPLEQYQKLSREPIVFYKNMGFADSQVKWTIFAGSAFTLDQVKMFLPVKIIGKPLRARSTIISYTMNLELLSIPRQASKKFEFETIWPYILYLFNHWVKHQVTLMGIKRILPGMQDRLPDSNYTIFECHNDLREDFEALEDEAYRDMLNFSSEIEIDPRFEPETQEPDKIEKSRPEGIRKTLKETSVMKRKKLFQEYRNSVAKAIDMQEKQVEMAKGRRFVQFAEHLVDNLTVEEQMNLLGDNIKQEQTFFMNQRDIDQFKIFLSDHYVRLPKASSNQIKLMQAMSQSVYWLLEKKGGLSSMQVAIMNEERRKIKNLPSLTQLDYNCIDRAAIKLRLILDCLQIERRISGRTLVPRNLKHQQRIQMYNQAVHSVLQFCFKKPQISIAILKLHGKNIQYATAETKEPIVKLSKPQPKYEDALDQEILGNQDSFHSNQIGMFAKLQSLKEQDKLFELQPQQEHSEVIQTKESKNDITIEAVMQDEQVIEQGVLRFNDLVYLSTLVFKTINCNYDNIIILHQIAEKKFQKESKKFPLAKGVDLQDRGQKDSRQASRPCTITSSHPHIQKADAKFLEKFQLKGNQLIDLQLTMSNLESTTYSSYAEIKVCPRLTSTLWADSVLVTWESMAAFFAYFGISHWDPISLLKRGSFNQQESLIFYKFFSECLSLDETDNVSLKFDLKNLNPIRHYYDLIFLNLHRYEWTQRIYEINFFYPNILRNANFDATQFDELIYPFNEAPQRVSKRLLQLQDSTQWFYGKLSGQFHSQKLESNINFQIGQKPDVLVEESTIQYLKNPSSLFNLTLTNFPLQQTLFLGSLQLKPIKSEFVVPLTQTTATRRNKGIQHTASPSKFNLRIDYYVRGVLPCLSIRAFTQLAASGGSAGQILTMMSHDKKLIKDIIRISSQTSQQMVSNQLQSLFSVETSNTGKRLQVNHTITNQKKAKTAGQDIYAMLVLNEKVLAQRLGPHNTHSSKGIINLRAVSSGMSSVLCCVNQYDVQLELLLQHGDLMVELIHGNKHITKQMIQTTRELILQKTLEQNPYSKLKEFRPLSVFKIQIQDMRNSLKHDAIITHEDLSHYFESSVFQFFRDNQHVMMPSTLTILHEYLLNLERVRTSVGTVLQWNLPTYKPQIDENGVHLEVTPDQLYKIPMLQVYQSFLTIREQQNVFQDQNKLPLSLDADKKQRYNGKVPQLCLRTKLAIEKILPVYETTDLRALKYSSCEQRVITQVTRVFSSISEFHFAIITVTQHSAIESWIWTLYFPITQRTFTVTFYQSDLIGMDQQLFENIDENQGEAALWTNIVNQTELIPNLMGDYILRVDSYNESIKELLYQTYLYNDHSKDLYFIEVTFKSFSNYVTDLKHSFPCLNLKDEKKSKEYTISLRAYSLAKEQWVKDYQPLVEVIAMLKQDGVSWGSESSVDQDQLMMVSKNTTNFYYSMIRNAAVLMANKITFSDRPQQNQEVRKRKLTYDLQQILKAKKDPEQAIKLRNDFQNIVVLNRVIYQATVALNPVQICSVSYNESKERFLYRLYRPFNGCESIERRFDGAEIQKTCCPNYQSMLGNAMERELGQRIAQFYHANILVASVLQINNLHGLVDAFPNLDPNQTASL